MQRCKERDVRLEQFIVDAANRVDSKHRQVATVGKLEKNEVNAGLLDLVRQSDVLKQISK